MVYRKSKPVLNHSNESMNKDFMNAELYNGQRIKLLALVDNFPGKAWQ
jgi:hypothetical protein